jgi:hypothetical protein
MIASRHEFPMKLCLGRFELYGGTNIHSPTDSLVSGKFSSVSIGPLLRSSLLRRCRCRLPQDMIPYQIPNPTDHDRRRIAQSSCAYQRLDM